MNLISPASTAGLSAVVPVGNLIAPVVLTFTKLLSDSKLISPVLEIVILSNDSSSITITPVPFALSSKSLLLVVVVIKLFLILK